MSTKRKAALAIICRLYPQAASKRKSGAETHFLFEGGSRFLSLLMLLWRFTQGLDAS
jgi:hypothetical protein